MKILIELTCQLFNHPSVKSERSGISQSTRRGSLIPAPYDPELPDVLNICEEYVQEIWQATSSQTGTSLAFLHSVFGRFLAHFSANRVTSVHLRFAQDAPFFALGLIGIPAMREILDATL